MRKGDKVICINDYFPVIKEYGGRVDLKPITPKEGDVLIVDEVLGEFLRFNLFDSEEAFNWWHKSKFVKVDDRSEALANREPIQVSQNVWDIAPEREEVET